MDEATRKEIERLDEQELLSDEVQTTVTDVEWQALIQFNTYCANRLDLTLEFYRRANGKAMYRFRQRTDAERQEWAEGRAEDVL